MFRSMLAGCFVFVLAGVIYALPAQAEEMELPLPPPPSPMDEEEAAPPPVAPDAPAEGTTEEEDEDALPPPPGPGEETIDLGVGESTGAPGKIVGGRVNVRAGASTKYEIIVTVDADTPVVVYERVGDWIKIGYPPDQHCYVHTRYLEGEPNPDIPAAGEEHAVKADKVNLRARSWIGSTVVGQVGVGDTVTVTGLRGQWARIKPPHSARAWVYYKYVQHEGTIAKSEAEETEEEGAGGTEGSTARPDGPPQAEHVNDEAWQKYYDEQKQRAELELRRRRAYLKQARSSVVELRAELARIDEETAAAKAAIGEQYQERREEIGETVPPDGDAQPAQPEFTPPPEGERPGDLSTGGYSGWVEHTGFLGSRPAAYRLVKGGEVLFLLRSAKYDLSRYKAKRVVVRGRIESAPGWEANVLVVDELRLVGAATGYVSGQPRTMPAPEPPLGSGGDVSIDLRE